MNEKDFQLITEILKNTKPKREEFLTNGIWDSTRYYTASEMWKLDTLSFAFKLAVKFPEMDTDKFLYDCDYYPVSQWAKVFDREMFKIRMDW